MDKEQIEKIKAESRSELASSGGMARKEKLSPERRKEIAMKAGMANKKKWEDIKNNKN